MDFRLPRLYAIIDSAFTGHIEPLAVADVLLSSGVRLIQYRGKQDDSRRMFEACCGVAEHVRQAGGTFIVNDRADVALLSGSNGVHLGQDEDRKSTRLNSSHTS